MALRRLFRVVEFSGPGVPAADWMRPVGRKPCCSAHKKASRCWSRRSGSTSASALATRALTSSIDVSLSLQYFSRRTSRLIVCGSRAAAEGTRSLRFMKTPRERGTHAARRCRGCSRYCEATGNARMRFVGGRAADGLCRPIGVPPDGGWPGQDGSGRVCGHCWAGAAIEGLTSRRRAPGLSAACWESDAFRRGALPRERTASTSRDFRRQRATGVSRAARGAMRLTTVVLRIFSVRAVVARTAGP